MRITTFIALTKLNLFVMHLGLKYPEYGEVTHVVGDASLQARRAWLLAVLASWRA